MYFCVNYRPFTLLAAAVVTLVGGWIAPVTPALADSWGLRFSRDGQQAWVEDSNSLDVTGPLTLEAWVLPESGIQDKWFDFVVSKNMNGTGYALLTTGLSVNHFEFGARQDVSSTSVAEIGKWVHIAGVWDSGHATIYVNGQPDATAPAPTPPTANECALWLGSSPFGGDTNWRGVIDEIRVWGVARSQQQILWDMSHMLTGTEPGLRAYWSFDEGAGQTAHDLTGVNHARLGNSWDPDGDDPEWVPGVIVPEPCSLVVLGTLLPILRRR